MTMDNALQGSNAEPFNCGSCTQAIAPTDPRIRCLICRNYDLCARCAIGERFTDGHLNSHQTQVYKESGGINGHLPILSGNTIFYAEPPSSSGPSRQYSSGHDQNSVPPPDIAGYPASSRGPPPLPPRPRPNARVADDTPVSEFRWQPFFLADMSPTPTFVTLSNDIFAYLDPSNSGFLTPEAYSRFLDDQDYLPHENVCASWRRPITAFFHTNPSDGREI
jgi:hypothetical protein